MTTTTPKSNNNNTDTDTTAAIARIKQLGAAAILTTAVAVLAGLGMLIVDPAAGSATEAVLGIAAAVSGLMTAVLAVAAAIYAHHKNLWSRLPSAGRYVIWTLIAIGIARTIWSQISNLN